MFDKTRIDGKTIVVRHCWNVSKVDFFYKNNYFLTLF